MLRLPYHPQSSSKLQLHVAFDPVEKNYYSVRSKSGLKEPDIKALMKDCGVAVIDIRLVFEYSRLCVRDVKLQT